MSHIHSIHLGGIDLNSIRVYTAVKGSRQELLYELNCWLFDYFYAHRMDIKQLPPLDDWNHSTEDGTYWYCHFPDDTWYIWARAEPLEIK